ncbi:MAG: flavin monoamine oxidase family protein [Phototrophicaceae bacterium]
MFNQAYDVIIIGAGAAGLAVARTLHNYGYNLLILEARDRLGGRTHTNYELLQGYPLELGGEFIHGQYAPTHDLVQSFGFSTIQVPRKETLRWGEPAQVAIAVDQLTEPVRSRLLALYIAYTDLLRSTPQTDQSLASYFLGLGFTSDEVNIADILFAQTCCAPIESLSCLDLIHEAQRDRAGQSDFRVRQGYSELFTRYSESLPIHYQQVVQQLEWAQGSVTVHTRDGGIFNARRCVITVPIGVLQHGDLQFIPNLPPAKQQAIATYRMEGATKLIYLFDQPMWDADLAYMARIGKVARWWTPTYQLEAPLAALTAFLTADLARQLDDLSEADALLLGLEEAAGLLGVGMTTLQSHLQHQMRVSWAHDPFARGGYAYIPVGGTSARTEMCQPVEHTLYFAGEAYATMSNPQTVHGAMESGWVVAHTILQDH